MGIPPLYVVEVNVTFVPEQIFIPGDAEIKILAAIDEEMVTVSVFDVAGLPVAQVVDEVISHVTASPVTRVEEV